MKHLFLLVDASGSMTPYVKETRESIKNIINGLDGNTHFKLVFFDTDEYQVVVDSLVKDTIPEIGNLFNARSLTPITDSVYKLIQDSTEDLSLMQLNEEHTVVIYTDGGENSSYYIKPNELGDAISSLTENFGWEFKFFGPESEGQNIRAYSESIKIKSENLTLYSDVKSGLKEMEAQILQK